MHRGWNKLTNSNFMCISENSNIFKAIISSTAFHITDFDEYNLVRWSCFYWNGKC